MKLCENTEELRAEVLEAVNEGSTYRVLLVDWRLGCNLRASAFPLARETAAALIRATCTTGKFPSLVQQALLGLALQ